MTGFPKFVIGAAALTLAGACAAQAATADVHTMLVNLPDGSVAQVQYQGAVPPRVAVQPVALADPFAQMDMISAMMDQQAAAMMQQVALMQRAAMANAAAAPAGAAPGVTVAGMGNLPKGVHMTYVSSTTDASGCTRTVSYSSEGGADAAPRVTQAASDACSAVKPNTQAVPAKAEAPAAPAATVGQKV
ncbi:hypothetical protein [Sphingomonas sp. R3G8C]|uniref:hypothetical protein n=1 Tax=Novosphingobium rhizosphaerae TaxID=1551649 RepID=UPI0015C94212